MATVNQPTPKPTAKVTAATAASAIVGAIVSVLALFGVIIPEGMSEQAETAVTGLIVGVTLLQPAVSFISGYFKKEKE